jgi:hypothetical protein
MGIESSLLRGKAAKEVKLTNDLHLVLRSVIVQPYCDMYNRY